MCWHNAGVDEGQELIYIFFDMADQEWCQVSNVQVLPVQVKGIVLQVLPLEVEGLQQWCWNHRRRIAATQYGSGKDWYRSQIPASFGMCANKCDFLSISRRVAIVARTNLLCWRFQKQQQSQGQFYQRQTFCLKWLQTMRAVQLCSLQSAQMNLQPIVQP